jgi:hypothetical protein
VATQIAVASGTLTLTSIGPVPTAPVFKPYAKVQKLPDLGSPSPTP